MSNNYKKATVKPTYDESEEVASARAALAATEGAAPGEYESAYGSTIKEIADKIVNGEKYTYDYRADPVYNVYREQIEADRRRAIKNAAASAAALTGGYANSYGVTAASEASAKSLDSLRSIIPALAEAAYKKWYDERTLEREKLSSLMDLENSDYSKWRDKVGDYKNERDYLLGKYTTLSDQDYSRFLSALSQWNSDRDYDCRVYEYDTDAAYRASRDAVEDAMKQKEYELELAKTNAAIAASAARSASYGSSKSSNKESSKSTKSSTSTGLDGITSRRGQTFVEAINSGAPFSGNGIKSSFVETVQKARRDEVISKKEYDIFMDYFRSVGIAAE